MKALSTKQATQVASVFKKLAAAHEECQKAGFSCAMRGIEVVLDLVQADLVMANLFEPSQKTEALFENEKGQYTWKAVPPKKAKKTHASK
jgi:hypothetical protein